MTIPENVRLDYSDGKDIDIYGNTTLIAYIPASTEDDKEVGETISIMKGEVFSHHGDLAFLGQFLGIEVQSTTPLTITKEVLVKDEREMATLRDALKREQEAHARTNSERHGERRAYESTVGILAENLKN